MTFEYHTIMRTTRGTSGHDCGELDHQLNAMAEKGWRLHTAYAVPNSNTHGDGCDYIQKLIFEREKHD